MRERKREGKNMRNKGGGIERREKRGRGNQKKMVEGEWD